MMRVSFLIVIRTAQGLLKHRIVAISVRTKRLEGGSLAKGMLANGCVLCTRGSKMVLFVTGLCGTGCAYCPVSPEKKGNDIIFANETRVNCLDDVFAEADSMGAEGTGITGGDPLIVLERTAEFIRALKERYGKGHHIHLYTSTMDLEKTKVLRDAGLDEIRFHPPAGMWSRLAETGLDRITKLEGLAVGLVVPELPDRSDDLRPLVKDAGRMGAHFININELEFSESNWHMMSSYDVRDDISSAVAGSRELASELIGTSAIPIHFCSSPFKDSVQLRRRLIRKAERTARDMDVITDDGTVIVGLLYTDEPDSAVRLLRDRYGVPDDLISVRPDGLGLEVAPWVLEELAGELPFKCCLSERYPTSDRLEVERTPLN
jgi:pyruvate formate-lyase activating enzyme-like uncharacterized protein